MKVAWGAAEKTLRESAASLGHELHVFRVSGIWRDGVGYTNRVVHCKCCRKVFRIIFCSTHGFHVHPEGLHGNCHPSLRQPAA
jgi:hypothetical protein